MKRARLSLATVILAFCLAINLMACGTTDTTVRPTTGSTSLENTGAADGRPALIGLRTEPAGRQTRVVLKGNQPLMYTAVTENQPPAIVVDVGALTGPEVRGLTAVKNGLVDKIEVEPLPGAAGATRVKIGLTRLTSYQVVRESYDLVVLVENIQGAGASLIQTSDLVDEPPLTAAQMSGGTAMVTAVDFKPVGQSGRTRLSIRTDRLVTPQVLTRDNGMTVVLSMAPADIDRQLIRPVDTTYFKSSVNYIKPTPVSGTTVEFVIRLREVVPYHLGQKGLLTYVDFDSTGMAPRMTTATDYRALAPGVGYQGPAMPTQVPDATAARPTTAAAAAKPSQAPAAPAPRAPVKQPGQPKTYTGQKISLDFQNADIHNILRLIGEVSGKNVVVSETVKGKVTLKLQEVPWDQALDIVLDANTPPLSVVESANVLRIDLADTIRKQKETEQKDYDQAMERAKVAPLEKRIFTPKYAGVTEMKTELEKLKGERGKLIVVGNDIHVEDELKNLEAMQQVVEKYDRVTKQILIESRIVEALSSFSKNLGVNWGGQFNQPSADSPLGPHTWGLYGAAGSATPGVGMGGTAVNLIAPPTMGLALGFGLMTSRLSLDAKLYAMEKTGEGRIVSAPRILASNDQDVYIKQGQSIPYETQGTTTAPAQTQFKDAVLELKVKPHIEENGKIISMDLTVTKDTPDYSRTVRNPPINRREAKTKLMVKNGDTVVIGGIIVDEKSKTVNRVPGLHRIPVLGWLFKDYEVSDSKLELLIFLTSNIIPVTI